MIIASRLSKETTERRGRVTSEQPRERDIRGHVPLAAALIALLPFPEQRVRVHGRLFLFKRAHQRRRPSFVLGVFRHRSHARRHDLGGQRLGAVAAVSFPSRRLRIRLLLSLRSLRRAALRVWVADDVPDVALGAEAATIPFFPHPQRLLRALLLLAETLALSPSRGSKHSKPDVGRPQFRADGRVRPRRSRHRARGPRGRSSSRARRIVVRALAAAARVVARPVRGGVDDAAGLEPDAARWPVGHARGVTPRGDAASE